MKKSKAKDKSGEKNKNQVFWNSGVVVAFISGMISLVVSLSTNARLKDIEIQKYQYNLHETRYEKLQESLEYFSGFKMFDSKYIYRFDIGSDEYSLDGVIDMLYGSTDEFILHLRLLEPYLSDEAIDMLEENGVFENDVLKQYDVHINDYADDAEVNKSIKEHLELVNSEYDNLCAIIVEAISRDIYKEYIPE